MLTETNPITKQSYVTETKLPLYEIKSYGWDELIKHINKIKIIDIKDLISNIDPSVLLLQENILSDISNVRITSVNHKIPFLVADEKIGGDFSVKCSPKTKKSKKEGIIVTQTYGIYKLKYFLPFSEDKYLCLLYKKINNDFLTIHNDYVDYSKNFVYNFNNTPDNSSFRDLNEKLTDNDLIICINISKKFEKLYNSSKTVKDIYFELESQIEDTTDPLYIKKLASSQLLLIFKNAHK